MRTSYNGNPESTFTSLPFGDSQTTATGTDLDPYHYAMLDYDSETNTDHAEFRQYSPTEGRWLAPDPYRGSYDLLNPQSLNRYVYALNNPLSNIDPSGLDCATVTETGDVYFNTGDCYGIDPNNEYYIDCDGCTVGATYSWNGSSLQILQQSPTGSALVQVIDGVDYTAPAFPDLIGTSTSLLINVPAGGFAPGGGGGGGGAANNPNNCSVLNPNCKKPGPVTNYLTYLACENTSIMETISEEEDGQGWTAYGFVNVGAAWAVKTKQGNLIGLTLVATAAVMDISAVAKANAECTNIVYGH